MHDSLLVHVVDCCQDLPYDLGYFCLTEESVLFDVVEEVSSFAEFEDEDELTSELEHFE